MERYKGKGKIEKVKKKVNNNVHLRDIPSVNLLLQSDQGKKLVLEYSHEVVLEAIRESIERFRQEQGEGAKFSTDFERARVIRDVFFRNGSMPQVTFTIKPLIMDPTITVLKFNIGTQTITYNHGPRVPTSVTWPASDTQNVTVTLVPAVENGINGVTESGLWALHRLFDKYAQIEPGATSDVFNIVLNVGSRKATFEVKSSGVYNPFRLPELENFSCPREML